MKLKAILAVVLSPLLLLSPLGSLQAALTLRLSADNGTNWVVVEDNGPLDGDATLGAITCFGPVPGWALSITAGQGAPFVGTPSFPNMDLMTINDSSSPATLIAQLSADGLTTFSNQTYIENIAIDTDGTISNNCYFDSSNILFGTTETYSGGAAGTSPSSTSAQMFSAGPITGSTSVSNGIVVSATGNAPHSITIETIINHTGSQNTSVHAHLYANPPPSCDLAATALTNLLVNAGATAVFSTTASGTGSFSYAWFHGTNALTDETNSSLTLTTVSSGDAGDYSVVVANGCASLTNSATLQVNNVPSAQSQSVTLPEDSFTNVTLQATDADSDPLTFTIVTPPAHGTLANVSSNQYTYVPDTNYFGADNFSFVANDGHADSAGATVSLTVLSVNDAPQLTVPGAQLIGDAMPLMFDTNRPISISDVDAGSGALELSLSVSQGTITLADTNGLALESGANGSTNIVVQGDLAHLNAGISNLTYTSALHFSGTDNLLVSVNDLGNSGDGGPLTDFQSVAITVMLTNHAPVFTSVPVTNAVGIPLRSNQNFNRNIIDLSSWHVLQYGPWGQPPALWTLSQTNTTATQSVNSDASILMSDVPMFWDRVEGDLLKFDTTDDDYIGFVFGYENSSNYYLFDWKQATQTNDPAAVALVGMNVKVITADPEVVGSDALWTTFESNSNLAHTLYHNSIPYATSVAYHFMLDYRPGDTMIQVSQGTNLLANIHLTDTSYPLGKFGFYNFSQAGVFYTGFNVQRIAADDYTYQAAASDLDGDTLTYSLVSGPTNMIVNATNGLIQWVPDTSFSGMVNVTLQVSDGHGGTALQTFPIYVPAPLINKPPFVDAGPSRAFSGITNSITLNGSIIDDGVPTNAPLTVSWSKVFGPGNVTFGNSNAPVTTALFSTAGFYRLQLVGSDSLEFSTNTVDIRADMLCTPVPTNIVAWLPANLDSREVIGGTTAVASNISYVVGEVGAAFNFNNSSNSVRLPAQPSYDVGTSPKGFTLEFWMKPASFQNGALLGWANGVRIERFSGAYTGDSLHCFVTGTNAGQFVNASNLWLGASWTWTHIALTYDAITGQASVYANGVLAGSAYMANPLSTAGDFYLAQVPGSVGVYVGALDDVSIYSRPLDAEEIYQIFAAGLSGKCPEDNNLAPEVFAGPDLYVRGVPGITTLQGEVTDDGLPSDSLLHSHWSVLSGPGTVSFADSSSPTTGATFSTNGVYVLQLTADDGEAQSSDLVEVRVEDFCAVDNPQGLVAWWPANGLDHDAINGYDAIRFNGANYTIGRVASAFNFDGTNDYVQMPAQTNYDIAPSPTGFTVEFWLNAAHFQDGSVLGWANGVRAERFNSGSISGDSLRWYLAGTNSGQFLVSQRLWAGGGNLGKWVHLVLTYQRSTGVATLYVNGLVNATANVGTNILSTAGDLYLENVPGSPSPFSTAELDEVSLYSRPLSRVEIISLFASGSIGKCVPDSDLRPQVYAGPDITLASTNDVANLSGFVTDDGLPVGSVITTRWQSLNFNPGTVTFGSSNSLTTTATFATNGVYSIQLLADDGEKLGSDSVDVRVGVGCPALDIPGMVAWWPANGSAIDKISGIPAVLMGADYTNGKVAQAFNFHGTNDFVFVPAQTNYDLGQSTDGFSIEFWIRGQFISGNDQGIWSWNNSATNGAANGVYMRQSGSSISCDVRDVNGVDHFIGSGVTFDGGWHHVALTYDRVTGQLKTYLDGAAHATNAAGAFQADTRYDLQIGRALHFDAGNSKAQFDEIALYNRPLTLAQVQSIFNAGIAGKCITPSNMPPLVSAGSDKIISLPTNTVTLDGAVFDDALPSNTLAIAWTYIAGDSTVFFSSTNTAATSVTFTNTGTYTFQLTASDGQFTTGDTVTVTVLPDLRARPTVTITAPEDQSLVQVPAAGTTNLTIAATAADTDGQVTNVEFFVNGASAGTASNAPYSITVPNLAPATYVLTAIATDNDGLSTTSAPVTAIVFVDSGEPEVGIFTPADSTIVTAPTNIIGLASSSLLQSWQLRYRLAPPTDGSTAIPTDDTGWTTLASGSTSVMSNTLATFDPTMLLNGIYQIQVVATDLLDRTAYSEVTTLIVDRNLKIGQFTISFNDLSVPVPGLPIQITRTYDSRAASAGIKGDFGTGWTLDIRNVRLQKNRPLGAEWQETSSGGLAPTYALDPGKARIVSIIFPDGRVEKFLLNPNPSVQPFAAIESPKWRFTPIGNTRGTLVPAWFDDSDGQFLIVVGDVPGTVDLYDLNYFSTNTLASTEDLNRNPTLFRYTSQEGYRYLIDEINGLQSVTDPNGNTLLLGTNGLVWTNAIAGTNSLAVAFRRDNLGRITNIVDLAGNSMKYAYDTNGNLVSFTDRVGQTNGFAYTNANFPHHLTGITDARGLSPLDVEYDGSGRLVRNTDIYGNAIQYTNDITRLTSSVTDRNGNTLIQEYDSDGNVVRATDALGGITTCTYDDEGHRLTRTNPLGLTEQYFYDPTNGALITVVNALNQTNTFQYNSQGQVTNATERDGTPLSADYDSGNNVIRVVDTLGNATVYAYNSSGKTIYSRDALGNEVHAGYDAFGNLAASTNALGHVSQFAYDLNNRITTQILSRTNNGVLEFLTNSWTYDAAGRVASSTNPDGSVHQTIYDGDGHIAVTIDELGRATTNNYDRLGRLVQTIYPDRSTESYGYDAGDRKVAVTNRLGQVTRYDYDALNRLTITVLPDGTGTTNFYDASSRMIATSDGRGNKTCFGYDAAGRSIATTNALGEVSTASYDARGNQITSTDALGHTTTNVFDFANRLVAVLYPDGSSKSNQYDALGRKVSETDQANHTTLYGFDALGRLTSVTNALGQVTRYEYDDLGEQTAQIDASGRVTRYAYDNRGRRISRILPLGQSDLATFDDAGNMSTYRDFNGNVTTYQYDSLNRLLQKIPDSTLGDTTVSFGYNSLGLRTNMTDASGVTTYIYNNRNQLIQKVTPEGTLLYGYDADGGVTNINSTDPNGVSATYEYDALNRLSAVNDARLGRTTYAYDAAGNMQGVLYPNFASTTYAYDSLNRLTNVNGNRLMTSLARYDYTLDPSGHRTSVTELSGRVVNYAYDALYELTNETVSGVASAGSLSYAYDAVGNRLARNSSLPGILASTYSYDANDRLSSDTYDSNGNTRAASLADPVTGLPTSVSDQYDFENRLVNRNNGQIQVVYDGDGNRVRKIVTTATNTVTTYYLVDDLNPSGSAQVIQELTKDTANPSLSTPTVTRVYTWGHSLIAQDRLHGSTWTESYYGYDGQGSVRYLTDSSGNVTDTYNYDAFGNLTGGTGSTPNDYLYQGEQYDRDLKLYYLRARYADPDRGRFWTMDSFEGFGTDPQSLHKYTFNQNDPVNRHDPSGHESLAETSAVESTGQIADMGLRAFQQAMLNCRMQSALAASVEGGLIGGAVSEGITAVVGAFTGNVTTDGLLKAYSEGFEDGSMAGFAIGFSPFTASVYFGYSATMAGMDFWKDYNNPDVPLYVKYLEAANVVASLLPLMPSVATKLNEMLQTFCFPVGTQVAAAGEQKPIQEIRVGDLVWAQSDETGEITLKPVRRVFANIAASLVILHCGTNLVKATPEHPFWVVNQGWKAAKEIQIGDDLWNLSGEKISVTAIKNEQGEFTVYNFEVEDAHSYFVGEAQILVHNKCLWGLDPLERGEKIEEILSNTEYSEANGWGHVGALDKGTFPLVDFGNGTTVVSLKTVDRGANSSWGDLFQHARELAETPITEGGKLQNKILDLRVPPGKIQSVDALKNYAESLGLTVKVSVFK